MQGFGHLTENVTKIPMKIPALLRKQEAIMQDTILVFSRSREQAVLAARTLRYREVYCLPVPFDTPAAEALRPGVRGAVVICECGGSMDGFDTALLDGSVPVLALGGAAVFVCEYFGGSAEEAVPGRVAVTLSMNDDTLFEGIDPGERMLPAPSALNLPEALKPIATATEQVIGFQHTQLPLYALQYPIERNDPDSAQLLFNFASAVCGMQPEWTEDANIDRAIEHIRECAPEGRVLCAVSGGVDSAVCARLTSMAVGDRLLCVFIDTGLFREGEPETVAETFRSEIGIEVERVDAHESFLRALSGVTSPRDKERIASQLMTQVLIKQFMHEPDIQTIVMGTNLNDTLFETGRTADITAGSRTIRVCEPIRSLFKDEVRRIAGRLSLPAVITGRQPFPSSGLALRVMTNVTAERLQLLRKADMLLRTEILEGGHDRRLWQFYATLSENPDSPGGYAVCLRATQTAQGGAVAARLPYDLLERTTEKILAEVPGAARVVYDLTPSAHYGELE